MSGPSGHGRRRSEPYGMNIIVNDRTDFAHLAVVVTIMVIMSATQLTWAKRQGWW